MWIFYYLSFPYSQEFSQEKGPTGGPAQDSLADEFLPVRVKQCMLSLGQMQTVMKGNALPCRIEQSGNKPLK